MSSTESDVIKKALREKIGLVKHLLVYDLARSGKADFEGLSMIMAYLDGDLNQLKSQTVAPEDLSILRERYDDLSAEDFADNLLAAYGSSEARENLGEKLQAAEEFASQMDYSDIDEQPESEVEESKTAEQAPLPNKKVLKANINAVAGAFIAKVQSDPSHNEQALKEVAQVMRADDNKVAHYGDVELLDQTGIDARVDELMQHYQRFAEQAEKQAQAQPEEQPEEQEQDEIEIDDDARALLQEAMNEENKVEPPSLETRKANVMQKMQEVRTELADHFQKNAGSYNEKVTARLLNRVDDDRSHLEGRPLDDEGNLEAYEARYKGSAEDIVDQIIEDNGHALLTKSPGANAWSDVRRNPPAPNLLAISIAKLAEHFHENRVDQREDLKDIARQVVSGELTPAEADKSLRQFMQKNSQLIRVTSGFESGIREVAEQLPKAVVSSVKEERQQATSEPPRVGVESSNLEADDTKTAEPENDAVNTAIDKLSQQLDKYERELKVRQSKNSSVPLNDRIDELQKVKLILEQAKYRPDLATSLLKTAVRNFNAITNNSDGKNLAQNIRAKLSSNPVADSRSVRQAFKAAQQAINPDSANAKKESKNVFEKKFDDIRKSLKSLRKSEPEARPESHRPGSKGR